MKLDSAYTCIDVNSKCYLGESLLSMFLVAVSAMMPLAKQCAFEEPSVETISGENVLTWPHVVSLLIFNYMEH